ncbi:Hypothetical predicted protein [Lecanosticta acicola]|uniref:DUF7907 domain-containing protein n=1 Tax=Lecanosticta acicola TaxID=111012 RepID=A0AAI9ECS8_9PEZI|nr:Hypothetical predicted protein [Lecanosticta acicola]
MHAFSLLALAGAASALPPKRAISKEEFTIAMQLGAGEEAPVVPLLAVPNGPGSKEYILVGQTQGTAATPVYATGTSPDQTLALDVGGKPYYMSAADIGDLDGAASTVNADPLYKDEEWSVDGTTIDHQLTAANNIFLACNQTVNSAEVPVLTWGSQESDGSYPEGCYFTSLYRKCNVPGSDASCEE